MGYSTVGIVAQRLLKATYDFFVIETEGLKYSTVDPDIDYISASEVVTFLPKSPMFR